MNGERQIKDLNDMITVRSPKHSLIRNITNTTQNNRIAAYHTNAPDSWKLATVNEDKNAEEVVVTVRGILCQKNLPPLINK